MLLFFVCLFVFPKYFLQYEKYLRGLSAHFKSQPTDFFLTLNAVQVWVPGRLQKYYGALEYNIII